MRKILLSLLWFFSIFFFFLIIYDSKKVSDLECFTLYKKQVYLKDDSEAFKISVFYSNDSNVFILEKENNFYLFDDFKSIKLSLFKIIKNSKKRYLGKAFIEYDYYFKLNDLDSILFEEAIFQIKNESKSIHFNIGYFEIVDNITIDSIIIPSHLNYDNKNSSVTVEFKLKENKEVECLNYQIIDFYQIDNIYRLTFLLNEKFLNENSFFLLKIGGLTYLINQIYYYLDYDLKSVEGYIKSGENDRN